MRRIGYHQESFFKRTISNIKDLDRTEIICLSLVAILLVFLGVLIFECHKGYSQCVKNGGTEKVCSDKFLPSNQDSGTFFIFGFLMGQSLGK